MGYVERKCDECGKKYKADTRNLNRGWGLCCSKSCAAKKREKSKPGYDPEMVKINNKIRAGKSLTVEEWAKLPITRQIAINRRRWGRVAPSVSEGSGMITGITTEGYTVMDGIAYDQFDDPVYMVTGEDDPGDSMYYDNKEY